jgi:hypothetical protein
MYPVTQEREDETVDVHVVAQQRLLQSLALAESGLLRLQDHSAHWESGTDPYRSVTEKIVVESALLCLLAGRVLDTTPAIQESVARLAALLNPLARTTAKAALLVKHPHTALPFGITHVALEKLGKPDPDFSAVLRSALRSGYVDHTERLPYRRLELAWLLALWDDLPVEYAPHRQGSILSGRPHPLHMSVPDLYALTHTLFYLTDFGRYAGPDELNSPDLSQCLDACMTWQLFEENVDTVGELLMSALLLPTPASPTAMVCWDAINVLWDEFGFLPGPSLDVQQYGSLSGAERDAYAFQNNYHTMYVGGLLNIVVLQRGLRAAPSQPADTVRKAVDGMAFEDQPYWVRLVGQAGRGLPAALVAEASIIHRGRIGAYADMANALDAAGAHGVSDLTLTRARSLLNRHVGMLDCYGGRRHSGGS